MSIDTTKNIKTVSYNGVNVPLAGDDTLTKALIQGGTIADLVIPDGTTQIRDYLCTPNPFNGVPFVTGNIIVTNSITIANTVTDIGTNVFNNSTITNLSIPSSVINLYSTSFNFMGELETLTFEGNPTILDGYSSFMYGCWKLKDIYWGGTKAEWDDQQWNKFTSVFDFTQTITLHATDGDKILYTPPVQAEYTIKLYNSAKGGLNPVNFVPAIAGEFTNWSTDKVALIDGAYTYVVTAGSGHEFLYNNNGAWDYSIGEYKGESDIGNFVLPELKEGHTKATIRIDADFSTFDPKGDSRIVGTMSIESEE